MAKASWINSFRSISDPDKLAEYANLAGPVMQSFGGRFVVRGQPARVFEAGLKQRTVIIELIASSKPSPHMKAPLTKRRSKHSGIVRSGICE
jgi:uncharacterized protein (DUF1330 family)